MTKYNSLLFALEYFWLIQYSDVWCMCKAHQSWKKRSRSNGTSGVDWDLSPILLVGIFMLKKILRESSLFEWVEIKDTWELTYCFEYFQLTNPETQIQNIESILQYLKGLKIQFLHKNFFSCLCPISRADNTHHLGFELANFMVAEGASGFQDTLKVGG